MIEAFAHPVGISLRGRRHGVPFALCLAFILAPAYARAGSIELIGQRYELSPANLPAPYSAPSISVAAESVARPDGVMPKVPKGFQVSIFASGLERPREMAVAPDGTVFVSQTHEGNIAVLRDRDGDGIAEMRTTFADGFREPSGLAVQGDALYVADRRAVWRIGFDGDTMRALPRSMVTRPGALGDGGGHITRELLFAPDGEHFFVSIGSETNVGEDPWPRATIQQFRTDGHMQATFASGLRNPVGLAFYPGTDDLYAVVNERFGLGAGLVPDYFTRVQRGGFYGYPYAYLGPHPDPQYGELRPDLVKASLVPDLLFAPHSGPLGLIFARGKGFPPDFKGDAIVALHGAGNGQPAGYELVRVRFRNGRPQGGYETFMTGFGAPADAGGDPGAANVWGRPVWLAEAKDGALLVSDDVANVIWRVSWAGPTAANLVKPMPVAPR
ncbi:MAG TPA: PQQ-dependent sugar dehydrogenase [Parvibaculum sp.]|jgi:glucose/arabinose dehydrogenase